jgi:hypothetical protein
LSLLDGSQRALMRALAAQRAIDGGGYRRQALMRALATP